MQSMGRMIESVQCSNIPDSLQCKSASGPRLAETGQQLMLQDTRRHCKPCRTVLHWNSTWHQKTLQTLQNSAPRDTRRYCNPSNIPTGFIVLELRVLGGKQSSISSVLSLAASLFPWHLFCPVDIFIWSSPASDLPVSLTLESLKKRQSTIWECFGFFSQSCVSLSLSSPTNQQLCLAQCLLPFLSTTPLSSQRRDIWEQETPPDSSTQPLVKIS